MQDLGLTRQRVTPQQRDSPENDSGGFAIYQDPASHPQAEESQEKWRAVRRKLNVHRVQLAREAARLEILTVAVYDGATYDHLFADMVDSNAEGTVVKTGPVRPTSALPFTRHTIDELTASGRLAPAAAGCLELAWEHRRTILGRS